MYNVVERWWADLVALNFTSDASFKTGILDRAHQYEVPPYGKRCHRVAVSWSFRVNPVDQTRFGFDASVAPPGNCWASCIASILGVPLENVPDEAATWKEGLTSRSSWRIYEPIVHAWLRDRGYVILQITLPDDFEFPGGVEPYCIMSGPSPRNPEYDHAVVAKGKTMVHDPHPSKAGLLPGNRTYEFFVSIDPALDTYLR